MAGFLSLMVINSRAIKELGVAATPGILVAGIATWLILPSILLAGLLIAVFIPGLSLLRRTSQ